jgi:hypothetical protein
MSPTNKRCGKGPGDASFMVSVVSSEIDKDFLERGSRFERLVAAVPLSALTLSSI